MIHVGFTEFRKRMAHYMDRARDDCDMVLITRQGKEATVMITLSEYERMTETSYLKASPANAAALDASIAELDAGRGLERQLSDL